MLPDEFDNREPPVLTLPFENPKDSDVLIALQHGIPLQKA